MEVLKIHNVTQFASGSHFTIFVTDLGKLFVRGDAFIDGLVLAKCNQVVEVPLPENYLVKTAYASMGNARNQASAIIEVVDKSDKLKKFLSAGKSRFGLLGQGHGVVESKEFKEMSFHFSHLYLTQLQMYTR